MELVLDVGNHRIKGAFFDGDDLTDLFQVTPNGESIRESLQGKSIDRILISSVNEPVRNEVARVLDALQLPHETLDYSTVKLELAVDEPEQIGHDRIANCYGALYRFPQYDCVIVDLGTAVTFDSVTSSGKYLGGAILPGMHISSKALSQYTDRLPEVKIAKPEEGVAKTTETHIQSGLYYGLLGAVERIVFEMRQSHTSPSDVKVLATGGIFTGPLGEDLAADIGDLVDLIDPGLTLIGIHEIMKEKT